MMEKKPRILIVDDDMVLLDLMSRRIEKMGYKPDRTQDGEAAVEFIKSNIYDLVVTDIYMPKITGIDLITLIKEIDPTTQVIAITGGAMIEKALDAIEKGAYAYMSKPFDHLKIFDHTVKKALEYRQLLLSGSTDLYAASGGTIEGRGRVWDEGYNGELSQIVECIPEALAIVDSDGEVVIANSTAKGLIKSGWDVKAIEPEIYNAALNGGSGASVLLNGMEYEVKAVELPKEDGDVHILFMLQSKLGSQLDGFHKARKYLEVLKTCLSWFYKQRMREKEFQVLRAMAVQVSKLEQIADGSYNAFNRSRGLTARLPAMQDLGKVLSDGPQ